MFLLTLIFIILFIVFTALRFEWAVMFLIATLPTYLIRFKILGIPTTLLELMILIIFIFWLFKNYKQIFINLKFKICNLNFPQHRYPFDWEIILWLLAAFTAAGVAGFSTSAMGIWKAYFFEPLLLYVVVFNTFGKNKNIEKILWPLAISALSVSLLAVYQKITGHLIPNELWAAAATRRVTSFFGYPNAVSLYLGPLTLIFTGWLMGQFKGLQSDYQISNFKFQISNQLLNFKILKLALTCIVIILSLLSIIFAKSVGGTIGVIAGLIIFGLLSGKKLRIATIIMILISAIGIFSYQPIRHKIFNYLTLNDFSGQVRKIQWHETWKMLKDGRLITGAGLANYQAAVKSYHQEGFFYNKNENPDFHKKVVFDAEYRKKVWQPLEIYLYPHNIFLNFWSELGIAGLILFIWIIIKFYYLSLTRYKIQDTRYKFLTLGLISAMTTIIVHGFVDVPYFKNDLSVMFWLFIAILGIINSLPIKEGEKN